MNAWDLPYLALLLLGLWAFLSDGRGLGGIERTLGFFGVGWVPAGEALLDLCAAAAICGLGFNVLAEASLGRLDAPLFCLGLASALSLGIAAVWLRSRL